MMSSVLRSHFVEVGDNQKECQTAVLRSRGILGMTRRATPAGLVSITAYYRRSAIERNNVDCQSTEHLENQHKCS